MPATTTLLGLVTPTQGTLSGTWGDTVNYGISDYVDISVAGTLTLTNDGAVTLANTTGSSAGSNITSTLTGAGTVTAQFAIVKVTGTLTVAKVVTGPSYSKTYTVVNAATGGIVTFKASGQTGVSIAVGESAFVYYNGTDYVKIVGTATAGAAGGSTTQVQYNNAGVLAGITGATTNGTALTLVAPNLGSPASVGTMPAFTLGGTVSGGGNQINNVIIGTSTPLAGAFTTVTASTPIGTASGGTGLGGATPFTSGGVVYASSSSALATGSALTFDGSTFGVTGATTVTGDISTTSTGRLNLRGSGTGVNYDFQLDNDDSLAYFRASRSNAVTKGYAWFLNNSTSEGMRLTSTGLGIGTSSPAYKLDVDATSSANAIQANSNNATYGVSVNLKYNGTTIGQIGSSKGIDSSGNLTDLAFNSAANLDFATGYTRRMRLDNAGNLGLGVTPSAWQGAFDALQFGDYSGIGSNREMTLFVNAYQNSVGDNIYQVSSLGASKYDQYNGVHAWYTAASGTAGNPISFTQAMTLDASGNLGVGTSSPSTKLDVSGQGKFNALTFAYNTSYYNQDNQISNYSAGNYLYVSGNSGATSGLYLQGAGNQKQVIILEGNASGGSIVFQTNSTVRATLDSAGNLGLGTAPSAWNSNRKAIQSGNASFFSAPSAASYSAIGANVFNNSGGTDTYISSSSASLYLQNAGAHSWSTAASGTAGNPISFTQAMVLDASGNLNIGTTGVNSNFRLNLTSPAGNGGIVFVPATDGSAVPVLRMLNAAISASVAEIGTASGSALYFSTAGTERARIPSAGGFQAVTTISVGNATPSSSGAGITFPATQSASSDANTLDDYEEGTWTPILGGTATYYSGGQVGTYTKIGRVVTFKGILYILSIGTGNTTQIDGLPFSIAANGGSVCSVSTYSGIATAVSCSNLNISGTTIYCYSNVGNSTSNQNLNAFFQTGTYLEFSGTYQV